MQGRDIFKIVPTASTGNGAARSLTTYRVARPSISSVKNTASGKMTVRWGEERKGIRLSDPVLCQQDLLKGQQDSRGCQSLNCVEGHRKPEEGKDLLCQDQDLQDRGR